MADVRTLLPPEEYSNYRNVRAVSVLFILLGCVLALGGIGIALNVDKKSREEIHPAVGLVLAAAGFAGAVGGIAALRGSRRLAPLVYVMAAVYVFGFPIGTILSVVMFKGLGRYLDSKDRLRST